MSEEKKEKDIIRKKLSAEEVRKIQIDLLLYLKKICEKNGLRYYLTGGTLLGAIRHKGFIPWDDDIDIRMPRNDFEKLLKIGARQKKDVRRRIVSWKTGETKYPFIKIIDTYTILKEHYMDEAFMTSVWIDVFPFDGMPEKDSIIKMRCAILNMYRTLFSATISEIGKGTTTFRKCVKRIIVPICRKLDTKRICDRMNQIASKYPIDTSPYVGQFLWGYGPCEKMPRDFLNPVFVEFEGHTFPAPGCWDYYLTSIYGNYMQLPPENQRINHGFDAWWNEIQDENSINK